MKTEEILSTAKIIEFDDFGVTKGNDLYWKWFVYSVGTKTPQAWGFKTIQDALRGLEKVRQDLADYRAELIAKGVINA